MKMSSHHHWKIIPLVVTIIIGAFGVITKLTPLVPVSYQAVTQAITLPAPVVIAAETHLSSKSAELQPVAQIGQRTKTVDCQQLGPNPDENCTPGATLSVTKEQICVSGYSANVRNVPDSEKKAVYAEYGVLGHKTGQYEVDHLISLELGGSNDLANLWPEPAAPTPGFHEKDKVENYLHEQVCSGTISLEVAQSEIAHDWLAVYQQMSGLK